jgi:hypothetical protein
MVACLKEDMDSVWSSVDVMAEDEEVFLDKDFAIL